MAFSEVMHIVTVEEAKMRLDELIAEAGRGGEIVITQDEKPVAKLAAAPSRPQNSQEDGHASLIGLWKGKITLKEGWDDPLEEMRPYLE